MRALSLWQPWASAIALGIKTVETRSWSTKYRGTLLIHATQRFPREARELAATERALGRLPARLPLGAVVAVATLADVRPTEEVALEVSAIERLYGDYTPRRWAWMLADVRALSESIPASGGQGLWRPSDMLEGDVSDALVEDPRTWWGRGERMTLMPGQWARTRGVWEERPDARHAVEASGTVAQDGETLYVGVPPATDCGVVVPDEARLDDGPVTCDECLWGWLDSVLHLAFEREAVPS